MSARSWFCASMQKPAPHIKRGAGKAWGQRPPVRPGKRGGLPPFPPGLGCMFRQPPALGRTGPRGGLGMGRAPLSAGRFGDLGISALSMRGRLCAMQSAGAHVPPSGGQASVIIVRILLRRQTACCGRVGRTVRCSGPSTESSLEWGWRIKAKAVRSIVRVARHRVTTGDALL